MYCGVGTSLLEIGQLQIQEARPVCQTRFDGPAILGHLFPVPAVHPRGEAEMIERRGISGIAPDNLLVQADSSGIILDSEKEISLDITYAFPGCRSVFGSGVRSGQQKKSGTDQGLETFSGLPKPGMAT